MPHSDALPLSHSDSKVSEIHYEVHIEHASCVSAYHLSQSFYKHDAIDIADLSSMQDACYVWTSYWASQSWSLLVVEHQSAEPEDLIFFSLSHACDKTKNIIPKLILQSKKVT